MCSVASLFLKRMNAGREYRPSRNAAFCRRMNFAGAPRAQADVWSRFISWAPRRIHGKFTVISDFPKWQPKLGGCISRDGKALGFTMLLQRLNFGCAKNHHRRPTSNSAQHRPESVCWIEISISARRPASILWHFRLRDVPGLCCDRSRSWSADEAVPKPEKIAFGGEPPAQWALKQMAGRPAAADLMPEGASV